MEIEGAYADRAQHWQAPRATWRDREDLSDTLLGMANQVPIN